MSANMDRVHELLGAVRTLPHPMRVSEQFCRILGAMNQPTPDLLIAQRAAAQAAAACSEDQHRELGDLLTQLSAEFKS